MIRIVIVRILHIQIATAHVIQCAANVSAPKKIRNEKKIKNSIFIADKKQKHPNSPNAGHIALLFIILTIGIATHFPLSKSIDHKKEQRQ